MKSSLEVLKKSLSEVLRKFKHELDAKFEKKLQEEMESFSEKESVKRQNLEQFEALMSEKHLTPVKDKKKESTP